MRCHVRNVAISLLLLLAACQPFSLTTPYPIPSPSPQDCAALSKTGWRIDDPGALAVGQSKQVELFTSASDLVAPQCESSLTSVTWTSDDPQVASAVGQGGAHRDSAWLSGVAPGTTAVRARVVFSDGGMQDAQARSIRVVPSQWPPAGSTLVAEGDVALDAPVSQPGAVRRYVPFKVQAFGLVDVSLDWSSPSNQLDFSVYVSPCTDIGACGAIVPGFTSPFGVKPLLGSGKITPGDYTLRIDNLGPGGESGHYDIRLTPQ
jgi:hypothetical protein